MCLFYIFIFMCLLKPSIRGIIDWKKQFKEKKWFKHYNHGAEEEQSKTLNPL